MVGFFLTSSNRTCIVLNWWSGEVWRNCQHLFVTFRNCKNYRCNISKQNNLVRWLNVFFIYLFIYLSRKNYWVNIASFTATYHIIHQSISVYKWVFTQGYLYRTPCTVTHRHSSQYHKNKCTVLSVHCWNTDTLCTFYIDRVTKPHENNGNSSHTHSSHNSSRAHDKFTWSEGCRHGAKVLISPLITVLHS